MKKREDHIYRELFGEKVLIMQKPVDDKSVVLTLNETSDLVYQLIDQCDTVEEIAARLAEEYDVPADEILNDVRSVLDTFARCGVIEL